VSYTSGVVTLVPHMADGKPTGTFVFTAPDPNVPGGAYIAEGRLVISDPGPMPAKGERRELAVSFVVEREES
jgi:hypothetical protein